MEFNMHVEMENDVFNENSNYEMRIILNIVAFQVSIGFRSGNIQDNNDNTIGNWAIEEEIK